jgi:hypothetical protein
MDAILEMICHLPVGTHVAHFTMLALHEKVAVS